MGKQNVKDKKSNKATKGTKSSKNSKLIKSLNDLPLCLSVTNVATALGISRTKADTLIHSDTFPKIKIGCRLVVPKYAFIQWINSQISIESYQTSP